jgi:hypothetical protein
MACLFAEIHHGATEGTELRGGREASSFFLFFSVRLRDLRGSVVNACVGGRK